MALAWEAAASKAWAGELTQAALVKILNELMEATAGESLKPSSIGHALNQFVTGLTRLGREASTARRYTPIIEGFVESLENLRRKALVRSLTTAEISEGLSSVIRAAIEQVPRYVLILPTLRRSYVTVPQAAPVGARKRR